MTTIKKTDPDSPEANKAANNYVTRALAALAVTENELNEMTKDGYYCALEEILGDVEGRMEIHTDETEGK